MSVAKAKPKVLESKNIEFVGYHEAEGSGPFKIAIQRKGKSWFLYTASLWKRGWSIFDVTDPANPKLENFVKLGDYKEFKNWQGTWTNQIQVADGKMITNLERIAPFDWGVEAGTPYEAGALIWDVSEDPVHPKLLGHYKSGGTGNHRNYYAGGRYVYMCTMPKEFLGPGGAFNNKMLAIVDISDPTNPKEVSRWWHPGQYIAGGEPAPLGGLHGPATVVGTRAFLSYGNYGMIVLDVSDVTNPRMISKCTFGDVGPKRVGCHTVLPVPEKGIALVTCEPMDTFTEYSYVYVVDISDVTKLKVLCVFPTPAPSPNLPYHNYWQKGEPNGRFGPHNFHHHQDHPDLFKPVNTHFLAYTIAGLRVYDLSDRFRPEEVGYFVPEDPKTRYGPRPIGRLVLDFDDVLVDSRGYAYCTEKNTGLYVLKYTGAMN